MRLIISIILSLGIAFFFGLTAQAAAHNTIVEAVSPN